MFKHFTWDSECELCFYQNTHIASPFWEKVKFVELVRPVQYGIGNFIYL